MIPDLDRNLNDAVIFQRSVLGTSCGDCGKTFREFDFDGGAHNGKSAPAVLRRGLIEVAVIRWRC